MYKNKKFEQLCFVSETMYGVKTKIIVADFSKGQFVYEDIERELRDIPVGILGQYNGENLKQVIVKKLS